MAGNKALALSVAPLILGEYSTSFPSSSSSPLSFSYHYNSSSSASGFGVTAPFICRSCTTAFGHPSSVPLLRKNIAAAPSLLFSFSSRKQICRAAEYTFPDPIPEFAESETEKFRTHLHKKLSKKSIFGDSVEEVTEICSEVSNFDWELRKFVQETSSVPVIVDDSLNISKGEKEWLLNKLGPQNDI